MLLGNGDMLFIPPGKSEPSRLQGAYLSSDETERLMNWYQGTRDAKRAALAAQGLVVDESMDAEPDILETVRAKEALEAGLADGEGAADVGRSRQAVPRGGGSRRAEPAGVDVAAAAAAQGRLRARGAHHRSATFRRCLGPA